MADLVWLAELSRNGHWLTTANLLLSALLLLWLLRYVRLYRDVDNERARQQRLIDHLPDGVYRSAPGGRQLSANRALVRLNGYDSEAEMLSAVSDIGAGWYVEPGRRDEFKRQIHATGHVRDFVSEVYRHKTRERIWISEDARLVRDEHGVEWYEGTVRDVTESVRRRQSEERLEKLADNLPGGLFQLRVSGDGKFSAPYVSRGFLSLLAAPGDPTEPAALAHRSSCTLETAPAGRTGRLKENTDRTSAPVLPTINWSRAPEFHVGLSARTREARWL